MPLPGGSTAGSGVETTPTDADAHGPLVVVCSSSAVSLYCRYFMERPTLAAVLLLVDGSIPPQTADLEVVSWLGNAQV